MLLMFFCIPIEVTQFVISKSFGSPKASSIASHSSEVVTTRDHLGRTTMQKLQV